MTTWLLPLLTTLTLATPDDSAAWPAFLGTGAGVVLEDSLPLTWSPTEHVAWKTPLPGYGQSSPVVWQDHVYLTSVEGPNKETCRIVALQLHDGKLVWEKSLSSSQPEKSSVYISRAAPTPAADEHGVYVFFESGDLLAYSHAGEVLWQRSLVKDYGEFQSNHGLAASPLLTEKEVVILADHGGPSYLAAFSKADGQVVWKTERKSRQSWSSPVMATVAGKPQIVVSSSGTVDGYDPASGKQLWTFDKVGGNNTPSPRPAGDGLILIGASVGRDGGAAPVKSNLLLRVAPEGDGFKVEPAWTAREATSSFGSPLVHQGYAYFVNRAGVVYCLDAKTGEQKYAERTAQSTWATPVGVGDRIYFFGKDGLTTVLAAGPEHKVLAENALWEATPAAPAPEGGQRGGGREFGSGPVQYGVALVPGSLLIRVGDKLYCLRNP